MTLLKKFLIALMLTVFVLTLPGCASTHSQTDMKRPLSANFQPRGKQATALSKQSYHSMTEKEEADKKEFILISILVVGAVLGLAAVVGYVILPGLAQAIGEEGFTRGSIAVN